MILVLGLLVVSIPVLLAVRTVARLVRTLGAIDASEIGAAIERAPELDLASLARELEVAGPGSIPQRLLSTALAESETPTPLARKLALAEEVAEIEREVSGDVRVPRVAASLATTGGLLAAALVMREGLGATLPEGADPIPFFYAVIEKGLILASIAIFGGIVCAALHRTAQHQRRARLSELDALAAPLSVRLFGPDDPD